MLKKKHFILSIWSGTPVGKPPKKLFPEQMH